MNQRVRCPQCRGWSDALLVWAAGDCCPSCNTQIASFRGEQEEPGDERALGEPGRILGARQGRIARERLSERA
jgi:hypothetical protein